LGFHKPKSRRIRQSFLKLRPPWPALPLDLAPIIHPGSLQFPVVELEPQRLDQVKPRPRGGAEPGDVAGVRRNFRFDENDLHDCKRLSTAPVRVRARSCPRPGDPWPRASLPDRTG